MKRHNGMRPHDILVLMKIVSKGEEQWYIKDLAHELGISQSEVSESLHRSKIARLLDQDKKRLNRLALMEFIQHGLPYVFPAELGTLIRGIPTSHSAEPLNEIINAEVDYVWPSATGTIQGLAIEPLHANVSHAITKDKKLYQMLTLIDAIRVGRQREKQMAIIELEKYILGNA